LLLTLYLPPRPLPAPQDGEEAAEKERPPPPAVLAQRLTFAFNIPLERFRDVPVAFMDTALAALQKLIQVERMVMDRLFWPSDPVMQARTCRARRGRRAVAGRRSGGNWEGFWESP
jgi:hypothetical protein